MIKPDIVTNVHQGIRKSLFDTCAALGRTSDGDERELTVRELLRGTLRFVGHHGENEDVLLLPLLVKQGPEAHERMQTDHKRVSAALEALRAVNDTASLHALYHDTCAFTALYLEHMRKEELELESSIRAALSLEQLQEFGRQAIARTAPEDQRLMLSWMLPAITSADAEALLSRLPAGLAAELRPAHA